MSQFVSRPFLRSSTYSTFQRENNWDFNKSYAIGGRNSLRCLPVTVSHSCLTYIDSHEIGPGKTPGPSDLKNSSNAGAIAGGIVGSIAAISIFVAALFLYRRRRRSLATSEGDGVFIVHMDQIQVPKSGQETVASYLPETTTPLMKPYVRVFVPSNSACTYSYVFLNPQNPDDPTTYPEYQGAPNTRYSPSPTPSPNRNLYTIASIPNSPAQGYRGLPII